VLVVFCGQAQEAAPDVGQVSPAAPQSSFKVQTLQEVATGVHVATTLPAHASGALCVQPCPSAIRAAGQAPQVLLLLMFQHTCPLGHWLSSVHGAPSVFTLHAAAPSAIAARGPRSLLI
jgi:hypothetical protein